MKSEKSNRPPQDPRDDPRWADVAPSAPISDHSFELEIMKGARASRQDLLLAASLDGTWVPGDPGPKGRKPIFRTGRSANKVSERRKKQLEAAGVTTSVGADDPGRPDTPDKVLDLVRSSRYLSWVWRLTTGEDPAHPVAQGGTRGGVRGYDRSATEYHFALHAAMLGETPEDICEALMAMGGKTAERGEGYFDTNILEPVISRLEKMGRVWGGGWIEPEQKPDAPAAKPKIRRVLEAAPEIAVDSETLNSVRNAARDAVVFGDKNHRLRHDVLQVIAGECIRLGVPERVALASFKAAGVNDYEADEAWYTTWGRAETGSSPPWKKKYGELVGDSAATTALERIEREVKGIVDAQAKTGGAGGGGGDGSAPAVDHGAPDRDPSTVLPFDEVDPPPAAEACSGHDHEPKTETSSSASAAGESSSSASAAAETSNPAAAAAARAKKIHPLSQAHLHLVRAKGELAPAKRFDGKNPKSDVLTEVRERLVKLKEGSSDNGKFWFVQKAVASTFAFAGLGLDLVTRTTGRTSSDFDALRSVYQGTIASLHKWKPGDELPAITSLSQIRSLIGHWEYIKLTSAITDGLHRIGAPFGVLNRASIDTPQSSNERIRIKYLLDRATKCEKAEIRGPLKFLEDTRKCGYLLNHQRCSTHNTVSKRAISCEREVSCRYCRSTSMSNIGEWMMRMWNHDKFVTFDVPATNDPVIKEIREKHEVDVNGRFVDPTPGSNEEDDAAKITLLPKAYEGEKRFRLTYAPNSEYGIKVKIKHRKRGRSKVVARKVVTDLLNRITIGFRGSHDWKEFKKIFGHQLGARAWPTTTGVRVVMPASFLPRDAKGEIEAFGDSMPVEQETMFHLMAHNLWQDRSPRVVSKEEAATLILDARREIGEDFDKLVHDLSKDAPDAESPDLDRSEQELLNYPFLKNNAMKPIRNKAALRDMPWFSKDQMTAFKRLLARERKGIKDGDDEVKPHECPMPVPDDAGGTKPCRRTLHNSLECEQGTIAHNSQGKHYPREEAFELADQAGVSFSPYGVPFGCFAPAEAGAPAEGLAPTRANL